MELVVELVISAVFRGQYAQIYNTKGGTIIGLTNYSPTYFVTSEHNPLDDPLIAPLEGGELKAVIPIPHS
ncbi:MAG: hypothetical protein Q9177_000811 [Variospora cf. flavescens]